MDSQKIYTSLMSMKVARKIREALGLNPWGMSQKLGKRIQSYQALERTTKNPNLKDIVQLHDIAVKELGWSSDQYVEEIRKDLTPANN